MKIYTKEEINIIEKDLRNTKNTVLHRKYHVIHLHMRGYTNKHISGIMNLSEHTVGSYIKQYINNGIEGLIPMKSPGRPSLLDKSQEEKLYEIISKNTPDEVLKCHHKNWTAKLACQWVKTEFNVEYSVNGMLDLFHRIKLSYTRPTYVLKKADPEKQKEFKEDFEDIKKTFKR